MRKLLLSVRLLPVVLLFACVVLQPALAEPAAAPSIFSPGGLFGGFLAPYIDGAIGLVITTVVGFLANWWRVKTGHEIDAKAREALETWLKNQASALIGRGAVKVKAGRFDVAPAELGAAVQTARRFIPDTLKRFGLDEATLAAKIVDHLPQVEAGALMIADARGGSRARAKR